MQCAPNTLSFLPWWTAFPQTQSKQTTLEILSCFLLDVSILRPWTHTVSLGGRSFLGTTGRVLFPISPISPPAPLGTLGRKMSEPALASLVPKGDCLVTEWMGEGREAWEEDVTRVSPLFFSPCCHQLIPLPPKSAVSDGEVGWGMVRGRGDRDVMYCIYFKSHILSII